MLTDRELMTVIQDFRRSDWIALRLVHDEMDIQLSKRSADQPLPSGWDQSPAGTETAGTAGAAAEAAPSGASTPAALSTAPAGAAPSSAAAGAVSSPAAAAVDLAAPNAPGPSLGSSSTSERTDDSTDGVIAAAIMGSFWVAPAPGAEPFVQPGDTVEPGQQVAIIEVMKLMTEVLASEAGTVAEVLAEDGVLVQAGQPLFRIVPNGAPA